MPLQAAQTLCTTGVLQFLAWTTVGVSCKQNYYHYHTPNWGCVTVEEFHKHTIPIVYMYMCVCSTWFWCCMQAIYKQCNSTVEQESFAGENFREFRDFGAIRESSNCENVHWVPQHHYQRAFHCRFLQFTKVLITKTRLSANCKSSHPRKITAIRYFLINYAANNNLISERHAIERYTVSNSK